MNGATVAAGVVGLAGLTGVFLVGRGTAPNELSTTRVVAGGVIQKGACLPPSAGNPDPCLAVVGTLTDALSNLGRSSYYIAWKKAYPADSLRATSYAASGTIPTPGMTTALGEVIVQLVEAMRYAHGFTPSLP